MADLNLAYDFLAQFEQTPITYLNNYKIINVIDEGFVDQVVIQALQSNLTELHFQLIENIKHSNLYRVELGKGWVAAVRFGSINEIMLGVKCTVYCMGFSASNWEEHRFNLWGIDHAFTETVVFENLCQMTSSQLNQYFKSNLMQKVIDTLNCMLDKKYLLNYVTSKLQYRYGADDFTHEQVIERLASLPEPSKLNV
ncbi:hypothetical protein [Pseudoalteromonas sp. G4]|uniref:hypothetical protein n=1 Tax=Pseudoalteromonas sp. G4 TaxID=2992761 RepID=UPI00237EA108|nr:hypothetical protein [Pseudoalteromonas sp. G4]MDE3274337.1 hypothetical protein [Pseudoalteromonas sp. G4]